MTEKDVGEKGDVWSKNDGHFKFKNIKLTNQPTKKAVEWIAQKWWKILNDVRCANRERRFKEEIQVG